MCAQSNMIRAISHIHPTSETREDRMRREIKENKAILKAYEAEYERDLSDLRARSDLSHEEKVRLKGPALPKRKNESAQAPSDDYEWLRLHIIKKIIQCPGRHKVPMHARQCIEYLKLMSPGDVVVLWLNHCATQHSRGHCNLHAGNDSYQGADMYKCLTVKLMVAINERFGDITSFKCGEVAGDLQKGNIRECCLTLTEGFENCAPGTQDEAGALVAVTQIYLDGISDLDGNCAVVSSAGFSSNMERLVLSQLESKSERIRIAEFSTRHLQFAARPAPLLDVEESATRVTQEFERLDKEVIQPFLDHIGRSDVSFIQHVKSHPELSFVTDHPDKLAKQYTLSWVEEKNKRINALLNACMDALRHDEDATVGSVVVAEGQENVILKYAYNHCEQLYKLPGADPTAKLADFYVRDILRNMGRNGGKKCQELLQQRRECEQCAASASGVCSAHEAKTTKPKRECTAEGCTNWAKSGGVCCTHGATVEKRECSAEGCTKWAVSGGVCCTHGATVEKRECSAESCTKWAVSGGVCDRHSTTEKKVCSAEGCTKWAVSGGVCCTHGATVEKRECSAESCTNVVSCAGGVCDRHSTTEKKECSAEGCTKPANHDGGVCGRHFLGEERTPQKGNEKRQELLQQRRECEQCASSAGGVCSAHEAKTKTKKRFCSAEGCTKWAVSGGVCCTHGATVERRKCSAANCTNWAVSKGVCAKHDAVKQRKKKKAANAEEKKQKTKEAVNGSAEVERKLCSGDGCTKFAERGGRCNDCFLSLWERLESNVTNNVSKL